MAGRTDQAHAANQSRCRTRRDTVAIMGFEFKVLSADGRRIRLLQLTPPIDIA